MNPTRVRPEAIIVMQELGIDLNAHHSKHFNEFAGQSFDYVLTVCDHAREVCPFFPGKTEMIHQGFVDPAACDGPEKERLALFRKVRGEIREYLRTFPPRNR